MAKTKVSFVTAHTTYKLKLIAYKSLTMLINNRFK